LGIPGLNFSHDNTGSINQNRYDEGSSSLQSSLEELDEFHDSVILPQMQQLKLKNKNTKAGAAA
jgi:hypothetical protein